MAAELLPLLPTSVRTRLHRAAADAHRSAILTLRWLTAAIRDALPRRASRLTKAFEKLPPCRPADLHTALELLYPRDNGEQ